MKKYAGFFSKVVKYGFYIVLFLCISAIGISGYVMYIARDAAKEVRENTTPVESLELPFPTEYKSAYNPAQIIEDKTQEKKQEETAKKEEVVPEPQVKVKEPAPAPKEAEREEKTVYTMAVSGQVSVPFSDGELVKSRTMDDWRIHEGVDIKAELGSPVLSIADGVVEKVENDSMLGNTVTVAHPTGQKSIYANLSDEIKVKNGDKVKAGQELGSVGASAIAECLEEPHLHLEVISGGKHIDPLSLFPAGEE